MLRRISIQTCRRTALTCRLSPHLARFAHACTPTHKHSLVGGFRCLSQLCQLGLSHHHIHLRSRCQQRTLAAAVKADSSPRDNGLTSGNVGVVDKPQGGTPPPAPRAPPAGGLANGGASANPFDALSTTSVRRPPEVGRPSPSPPAPQQYLEATICRLYYFRE
jgi:hypothetical protein